MEETMSIIRITTPVRREHYYISIMTNEAPHELPTVEMLTDTAWEYYQSARYDDATALAEKALALARQTNDKRYEASSLNILGNIANERGNYPDAEEKFRQALILHTMLNNKQGIAGAIGNIGNVYANLSDYPRALEHYSKALDIYEQLGNTAGVAARTGGIGVVYTELLDYPRALEYYSKALAIYEQLNNQDGMAFITGNIGNVYANLSDYPRALEYYGKALNLNEQLGNTAGAARNTGNIGLVYQRLGDYPRALECLGKALELDEQLGKKMDMARHIGNIGTMYADERFDGSDVVKAEDYLLRAISMNEEIGTKGQNIVVFKKLAQLYEQMERWKEANDYNKNYHELEKEVRSEEAKKQAEKQDINRKLAAERERARATQELLHNTLPPEIADRILGGERMIADHYAAVSVLFMDLVNFTILAQRIPPKHLVHLLNNIFSAADAVMQNHALEKIKTIGDAYMAVAGAPVPQADHAGRAAQAALELLETMNNLQIQMPEEYGDKSWIAGIGDIQVRIGLHCGAAVGGVIGDKKFTFDLWGDAVNTAARMEQYGEAGRIHISEEFAKALAGSFAQSLLPSEGNQDSLPHISFTFPWGEDRKGMLIERGTMEIKGKGMMKTYFLERAS